MNPQVSPSTDSPQYAGLGRRSVALVIDFFSLSLIFFPATRVVKGVWIMSGGDHLWEYGWFITDPLCLAFLILIVLYFVLLEGSIGATIGKRVMGLRVGQAYLDETKDRRSLLAFGLSGPYTSHG